MGIRARTCPNERCIMLVDAQETICPYCGAQLPPLKSDVPVKHWRVE